MPGYNSSQGTPEDLNRVGAFSGRHGAVETQTRVRDVAPPEADRKGRPEALGKRLALAVARWKRVARAGKIRCMKG